MVPTFKLVFVEIILVGTNEVSGCLALPNSILVNEPVPPPAPSPKHKILAIMPSGSF